MTQPIATLTTPPHRSADTASRVVQTDSSEQSQFQASDEGLSFDEVLNSLNPLHHVPIVSTIYQAVSGEFDWAYETVKTMLARLVKKGLIAYDQVGNSYLYRAVYSRPELSRAATKSFVKRVFDGALNPLMAYFAEDVSADDLKLLKAELRRIEREKREDTRHGDTD